MRGYDAGKKVKGRKRHIAVDTLGLVWARVVHEAGIQDRDGAKLVFLALMSILTTLLLVWADQGYAGQLVEWVKNHQWGWQLVIVKKLEGISGFHILPHRWVVEPLPSQGQAPSAGTATTAFWPENMNTPRKAARPTWISP